MSAALVIRGRYVGQTFISNEPLPTTEGMAELIVIPDQPPAPPAPSGSIFDLFGKAPCLRSLADIQTQLREEREAWGEP